MPFREIVAFDVVHAQLSWPWIAFAASGDRIAFASSPNAIATRSLEGDRVASGPSFTLPADLPLVSSPQPPANAQVRRSGLTAFSVSSSPERGVLLAVAGRTSDEYVVAVLDPAGERKRARVDAVLGEGHEVQAIAFDRSGRRLWLSAENANETVLALVDADTLEVIGVVRSAPFPRPALHEIHLHPQDDAVLLLAACGEAGSFARVVGFAGDVVSLVPSALDSGAVPAGFVGFSADGARVHLVEADELRTHAWPTLHELSSVPLADDFVSSFSGAVLDGDVYVDGENAESQEDAVMVFDRSAIRGTVLPLPAPSGMWAGRLGVDAIVTIEAKGDPARARILRQPKDGPARAVLRRLLS